MSKNNIIWLGIVSLIATLVIWLFHGSVYNVCYSPYLNLLNLPILANYPLLGCLTYSTLITLATLFLLPCLVTLAIYGGYVLLFNRELPYSYFYMWFFWFVAVYYLSFQLNFLPAI